MTAILEGLPLVKLPSFLVALTHCENQAHSVEQFVLAYHEEVNQAAAGGVEKQHEALLGEIDFVKHLVKYAVLKKYIRRVQAIEGRSAGGPQAGLVDDDDCYEHKSIIVQGAQQAAAIQPHQRPKNNQ